MKNDIPYTEQEKITLLETARKSIENGLDHGTALAVDVKQFADALREKRATFVTLHKAGNLRGCIGMLTAVRPLVEDIADNAFAAAFCDPRFDKLKRDELADLEIAISVLTPAIEIKFISEEDLLRQIQPGIDGLILEEGHHRGTFLPAVWEDVADARDFLNHLKIKAGLPADYWSDKIRVKRYQTEYIVGANTPTTST